MFKPYDHPLTNKARSCAVCTDHLPLGPSPLFRIHPNARIVLISQAPGRVAHRSGIVWDDQGGRRLREWMDIDYSTFYQSDLFAVLPMGFCYPGKGKTGDLPPRPECAPLWHDALMQLMPRVQTSILIGQYAQRAYLGDRFRRNLTETVRAVPDFLPDFLPLPHPSPLNQRWVVRNEWFNQDVIPILRKTVQNALKSL
jgi:uracil-DNA glycosylase